MLQLMRHAIGRLFFFGFEALRAPMRLIAAVLRFSLFNALFRLAHIIYSCFSILSRLWETRHRLFTRRRSTSDQLAFIRRNTLALKKKPRHIAFVFEDRALVDDVQEYVKVILWCMAADIRHITLYDVRGTLKGKAEQLLHLAQEKQRFYAAVGAVPRDPLATEGEQGFVLSVQSAADGRAKLVGVARSLARAAPPGAAKRQAVTAEEVDAAMGRLPETDVLLQCGGSAVGAGYAPWLMRLTEVFFSPCTAATLPVEELLAVLHTYAGCVQRYGT